MKLFIKRIPIIGPAIRHAYRKLVPSRPFTGSEKYWESRYRAGGNSGDGSYNRLAEFKAEIINGLVDRYSIRSVIEFGCGDGNQLTLARYPSYLGFDVSTKALALCRSRFRGDSTKSFESMGRYSGQRAELALSLDVIFHLVEDDVFENYMATLFSASTRFVVVYSSNTDNNPVDSPAHVRHRKFSDWVEHNCPDWQLMQHMPNRFPFNGDTKTGSFADFFIYGMRPRETSGAEQGK